MNFKVIVSLLVAASASALADTLFVRSSSSDPSPDGSSWAKAYPYLQDALAAATSGDEIWVAQGSYYPDQGAGVTDNDRNATFQLKSGVSIYGGFFGFETLLSQRTQDVNEFFFTQLNGYIDLNDSSQKSYHVLTGSGTDSTAVLDGFVISNGNANGGFPDNAGGGLLNIGGSPTLTNCFFRNISAATGGAIYNTGSSSPTFNNCSFTNASALNDGGAIYNSGSSSPALNNCSFQNNSASGNGGAIYNFGSSSPTLNNCSFGNNSATSNGGAIYNQDSSPALNNCIIWNNSASGANTSTSASVFNTGTSSPSFSYCLVANSGGSASWNSAIGLNGGNNIVNDPLYASTSNLRLQSGSPAIDAGLDSANSTSTDLDGNPRIAPFGRIDLGAFESLQFSVPSLSTAHSPSPAAGERSISSWAPDSSSHNDGAGFTYTFSNQSGNLVFDTLPTVDPDGTLRFSVQDGSLGNATFELVISDPGGVFADSNPIPILISVGILYVDADASGDDSGSSWTNAFTDLQDALTVATSGNEIWVAEGTYLPTTGTDRSISFVLAKGVAIYGGFDGTETERSQRDLNPESNNTVLSGDLLGDGTDRFNNGDNSYRIVDARGSGSCSILDGFTVTGGNGNGGSGNDRGGAVSLGDRSPELRNLILHENQAKFGGAIHAGGPPLPLLMYLPLEEAPAPDGTAFTDLSENNNEGTLISDNGEDDKSTTGMRGNAVDLDGTGDRIDATDFDVPDSFSIALWVNPATDADPQAFIGKHSSSGGNQILFGYYSNGYHFNIRNSTLTVGTPQAGWQHLVAVCTASSGSTTAITLYRDGTFLGSGTVNARAGDVSGGKNWTLGQDWDGQTNTDYLTGQIDEVSVWGRALSPDDVAALYGGTPADRHAADKSSSAKITNAVFTSNSNGELAGVSGGAIYLTNETAPEITNATFVSNYNFNIGGALRAFNSFPTFTNCTFHANSSNNGGAFYLDGGSSPVVVNSIFWANFASNSGSETFGGPNTIDPTSRNNLIGVDPLFIDAPFADYNVRLQSGSPAIDAGDSSANSEALDLDGNLRINPFGTIDIGAYEFPKISDPGLRSAYVGIPNGSESVSPAWAPDTSTFNDGSGLDFTFSSPSGDLTFIERPSVDPDGILRCTLPQGSTGSTTFQVTISDPSGIYAASDPFPVTIIAGILYVDQEATGNNNGASWTDAFTFLQDALNVAPSGSEIWVADGTYYPDDGTAETDNDRESSFLLKNGVALYGGFNGSEVMRSERDPATNGTILSGDLDQNDGADFANNENNAYHVVMGSNIGSSAVLDGFTITGGHADQAEPNDRGAGLFNNRSSPTITNCNFDSNRSNMSGAGLYNEFSSSPNITSCSFQRNSSGAGASGAGMWSWKSSRPVVVDCNFDDNIGGGIYNIGVGPTYINCSAQGNSREGLRNSAASPTFINCSFRGNFSRGAYSTSGGRPLFINCEIVGNRGGMSNSQSDPTLINCSIQGNDGIAYGGMSNSGAEVVLVNCIIWNNTADGDSSIPEASVRNTDETPIVTYQNCLIANSGGSGAWVASFGSDLGNNLDTDPLFVSEADPLTSPTLAGDLRLQPGSPAIDAGDSSANSELLDVGGLGRVAGGAVDLGAHEFYASFELVFPGLSKTGDDNNNGLSNYADYALGGDPTAPDNPSLRPRITEGQITFSFRNNAADVFVGFQKSETLLPDSWTEMIPDVDYTLSEEVINGTATTQTFDLPSIEQQLFFRESLKATP